MKTSKVLLLATAFLIAITSCTPKVKVEPIMTTSILKNLYFLQEVQAIQKKYDLDTMNQTAYAGGLLALAEYVEPAPWVVYFEGPTKKPSKSGSDTVKKCCEENSEKCITECRGIPKINDISSRRPIMSLDILDLATGENFGEVDLDSENELEDGGYIYKIKYRVESLPDAYTIKFSEEGRTKEFSVTVASL